MASSTTSSSSAPPSPTGQRPALHDQKCIGGHQKIAEDGRGQPASSPAASNSTEEIHRASLTKQVFVANLPINMPLDVIEMRLAATFHPFGNVEMVRARKDNRRSLPIAFVHFREAIDPLKLCDAAMTTLCLEGRKLRVEPCRPRNPLLSPSQQQHPQPRQQQHPQQQSCRLEGAEEVEGPTEEDLLHKNSTEAASPRDPCDASCTERTNSNETKGYAVLLNGLNLNELSWRHILVRMAGFGHVLDMYVAEANCGPSCARNCPVAPNTHHSKFCLPPYSALVLYSDKNAARKACQALNESQWSGWIVQATLTQLFLPPHQ